MGVTDSRKTFTMAKIIEKVLRTTYERGCKASFFNGLMHIYSIVKKRNRTFVCNKKIIVVY